MVVAGWARTRSSYRADAEKNADNGADPKPEHA
jgi:hypothetical protein